MKRERNNEMDLLLRRMSRHDGNAAHNGKLAEQHLDADELSAYAQNALPAAARARYIEHLAECASCRKLATELSLSLGATTAAEVDTVGMPSGLKAFLAKLFSPLVLRYAAPVLGVIVVMVVGFVVLRQRQFTTRELVARVETKQQQEVSANGAVDKPTAGAPATNSHDSSPEKPVETAKSVDAAKPAAKSAEPKPESSPVATDTISAAAQPLTPAERSVVELRPGVATSAPAAAKTGAAETEADKKTQEGEKKPGAAAETVDVRNEPATAATPGNYQNANNKNESTAQDKAKVTASGPSGAFSVRGLSSVGRRQQTKREDETKPGAAAKDEAKEDARDDAETRSIGGRQFRKARGIWVDTAYDSSTATVNMARGSEQFRALVADEPGIGTIAKQLDGEVIVVWKGRAYRIR